MNQALIEIAEKHMDRNWAEIGRSTLVGCSFCRAQFAPSEITKVYGWTDGRSEAFDRPLTEAEPNDTARCPKCELPYVIGDASGLPIADKQYLSALYEYWFNTNA
jgi:hypothetical protein